MSVNRTPISRTRTLLIILGIVLAFLLTLNASSLFTADNSIPTPNEDVKEDVSVPDSLTGKIEMGGIGLVHFLIEKFATLK